MKNTFRISLAFFIGIVLAWSPATGLDFKKITSTAMSNVDVPAPIVDQLGALMYNIKLKKCHLDASSEDQEMTDKIWEKLKSTVSKSELNSSANAQNWQWECMLVNDVRTVDAEAFPGGKILVYSGSCALVRKDQAQMAFILSHEMAHALARHAEKRFDEHTKTAIMMAVTGGGLKAAKVDDKLTLASMAAMGISYEGAVVAPFSRDQEAEADQNALMLMAHAGFDPHAAINFLQNLKANCGDQQNKIQHSFMEDHPPVEERLSVLNKNMSQAMEIYQGKKG